jgi:hypothetical protein
MFYRPKYVVKNVLGEESMLWRRQITLSRIKYQNNLD